MLPQAEVKIRAEMIKIGSLAITEMFPAVDRGDSEQEQHLSAVSRIMREVELRIRERTDMLFQNIVRTS